MLTGHDTAHIYRRGPKNRDGDAEWVYSHSIERCVFELSGTRSNPQRDRSDGGLSRYGAERTQALHVPAGSDIQVTDRVEVHGTRYRVVAPPVTNVFPSGRAAPMQVRLTIVEKW